MDRRAYLLLSGVSLLLVVALLGTPVWDRWYYGALRSSPGSSVPVAVLLAAPAGPHPEPRVEPPIVPAVSTPPAQPLTQAAPPAPSPASPAYVAAPSPPVRRADAPRASAPPPARGPSISPEAMPAPSPIERPYRPADAPVTERIEEAPAEPPAAFVQAQVPPTPPPADPEPPKEADAPSRSGGSSRVQAPPSDSPEPEPVPVAPPIVTLALDSTELSPGESLVAVVQITGAVSISSVPFHLRFDPSILEFVDSQVGAALDRDHEAILLASVNPNRPGDLAVGLSLVESSGLFSGSGDLLRLRFRAMAPGESTLEFVRATVRDATSQPLEARFETASIKVRTVR